MLSAKNITYKVDKKTLLDDVSVDFEAGKLNLIIGPNGAGKSTFIKIICDQIQPESGSVYYAGKNISTTAIAELARIRSVFISKYRISIPFNGKRNSNDGEVSPFQRKTNRKR